MSAQDSARKARTARAWANPAAWLTRELTLLEGKCEQVTIAQVSEIIARLADLEIESPALAASARAAFIREAAKRARQ